MVSCRPKRPVFRVVPGCTKAKIISRWLSMSWKPIIRHCSQRRHLGRIEAFFPSLSAQVLFGRRLPRCAADYIHQLWHPACTAAKKKQAAINCIYWGQVAARGSGHGGGLFTQHKDMKMKKTAPCCWSGWRFLIDGGYSQRGLGRRQAQTFDQVLITARHLYFDIVQQACGVGRTPFQKATATWLSFLVGF